MGVRSGCAAVVFCVSVVFLPGCRAQAQKPGEPVIWILDEDDPCASAAARATLGKRLPRAEFDRVNLGDAIQFLRDRGGLSIDVRWEDLRGTGVGERTPVTLRLTDATVGEALRTVLQAAERPRPLDYMIRNGTIVVSFRAGLEWQQVLRIYDIRDLHVRQPEVTAALLEFMQVALFPRGWAGTWRQVGEFDGRLVARLGPLDHRSLERMLSVLRGRGADLRALPRAQASSAVRRARLIEERPSKAHAHTVAELSKRLPHAQFPGIGIGDAIQFFRDVMNVNIHAKWEALRAAQIDEKTPVNIRLQNVTLREAIDKTIQDVGGPNPWRWTISDGVITISTEDDIVRRTVYRVYDVSDLMATGGKQGRRPRDLVEAVAAGVGPPCNRFRSLCRVFVIGGRLVAALPVTRHRDVDAILAALREGPMPPDPLVPTADTERPGPSPASAAATQSAKSAPDTTAAAQSRPHDPNGRVRHVLDKWAPKLQFPGIGLGDVIQFFRDVSGLKIDVRWQALLKANIDEKTPVNVELRRASLRQAMEIVLDDVGGVSPLAYVIADGRIIVSTAADLDGRHDTRIYDLGPFLRAAGDERAQRMKTVLEAVRWLLDAQREELFPNRPWVSAPARRPRLNIPEGEASAQGDRLTVRAGPLTHGKILTLLKALVDYEPKRPRGP